MYNYLSKLIIVALFVFVGVSFSLSANAQTITMPVLYNQQGNVVNMPNNGSSLSAGTYYTNNNGTGVVYYYGNGRYYDPATMTYWGSSVNPNGSSGSAISILDPNGFTPVTTGTYTTVTPGVPNTGAGGYATENWIILAVGTLIVLGLSYGATKFNTI